MNTLQSALEQLIGKDVYIKLLVEKSFKGAVSAVGSDYLIITTSSRSHIVPYSAIAHIDQNSDQL